MVLRMCQTKGSCGLFCCMLIIGTCPTTNQEEEDYCHFFCSSASTFSDLIRVLETVVECFKAFVKPLLLPFIYTFSLFICILYDRSSSDMSVVNTICRLWTLLLLLLSGEGRLQCRDDGNRPVDWLVAYKLPLMKESSNPIIRKGLGYVYITSDSIDSGWTLSAKSANGSDSFLGHSLKPLYETTINNDLLWLLYNDETPNKTVTFDLGHTKGIVLSEVDGGIWLVHSVPRYPPIPGTPQSAYSYPHSGTYFGQSFLCISLAMDQLDLVGLQLLYNEPQVYSSNIPSSFKQSASHLAAVTQHTRISTAPWYHQLQLSTIGGIPFVTFAKTKKFGKDLYADWVAPSLKTNMLVETWPNGKGRLPSECQQPYKVKNIEGVKLEVANVSFKTHVDHSKWGVSSENTSSWVCVGDINRMQSQEARSGGTVCINNPKLWIQYRNTVTQIEPCSKLQVSKYY